MLISAGGGEPEELFPVEGATPFYFCDGAPHHLTVMLNSGSASVTVSFIMCSYIFTLSQR